MSTASVINSIEEHIQDAYDVLEVGGADLTNVNKNIENISAELKDRLLDYMNNGTEQVWNNWEKVTASDVAEATLNNTVQAPMKIDVKGDTEQTQLSGKNLFNKSDITSSRRLATDGTLTSNNAGNSWVSDFIPATAGLKYTKNSPDTDAYHRICYYSTNNESGFISAAVSNIYTAPANTQYIRFTGYLDELNTTQLEQNNTATSFEPYCGRSSKP